MQHAHSYVVCVRQASLTFWSIGVFLNFALLLISSSVSAPEVANGSVFFGCTGRGFGGGLLWPAGKIKLWATGGPFKIIDWEEDLAGKYSARRNMLMQHHVHDVARDFLFQKNGANVRVRERRELHTTCNSWPRS